MFSLSFFKCNNVYILGCQCILLPHTVRHVFRQFSISPLFSLSFILHWSHSECDKSYDKFIKLISFIYCTSHRSFSIMVLLEDHTYTYTNLHFLKAFVNLLACIFLCTHQHVKNIQCKNNSVKIWQNILYQLINMNSFFCLFFYLYSTALSYILALMEMSVK